MHMISPYLRILIDEESADIEKRLITRNNEFHLVKCRKQKHPIIWIIFTTAPGVCSQCVCVHSVCVHLDGLNAEHKFRVWVTILGHTSLHFRKTDANVCASIWLNIFFALFGYENCKADEIRVSKDYFIIFHYIQNTFILIKVGKVTIPSEAVETLHVYVPTIVCMFALTNYSYQLKAKQKSILYTEKLIFTDTFYSLSLCLGSLHDQLSHSHCDCGPASERQNLHF